jgi:hypothetical protein
MATDRFTRGWDGERHKGTRMGTLWADCDSGEGDVTLRLDGMCNENALFRLDVLQDWIGLLQREYDITLKEFDSEYQKLADRKKTDEVSI